MTQGTDKEMTAMEPWVMIIGVALVAIVAAMAAFTLWERSRTSTLEAVVTPTAVGDEKCITEPPGGKGSIGLKFQGQPLDMVSEEKIRDSRLLQAAKDDSGVYTLYRPDNEKEDPLPKGQFYIKVRPNIFIQAAPE